MTCQMVTWPTPNWFLISLHAICYTVSMMNSLPQIWSRNQTYPAIPPCQSQCHLAISLCHHQGGTRTQCSMILSWWRFGRLMTRFGNGFCWKFVVFCKCLVLLLSMPSLHNHSCLVFTNVSIWLLMMCSLHCLNDICVRVDASLNEQLVKWKLTTIFHLQCCLSRTSEKLYIWPMNWTCIHIPQVRPRSSSLGIR